MNITRTGAPSSPGVANAAFRGRFAADLTRFSRHKQKLLDALADGQRRGPNSAFDKDKSWSDLLHFARFYFAGEAAKKKEQSAQTSVKRLTEFADLMVKAQGLVPYGAYDHVGSYIFLEWSRQKKKAWSNKAWQRQAKERDWSRAAAVFDQFFSILPELEIAARKAAYRVRPKPGRPRGPRNLPSSDVIIGMAAAYRRCTGSRPGAGRGPFSRFAMIFLIALGHTGIKEGPLVGAIKGALHRAGILAHRNSVPSPFA